MSATDDTAARVVAGRMAEAAAAWLDMLDDAQRKVATGPTPSGDSASDSGRRRWFYTPTDHGGLTVHQQRPAQQRAAMRLIASGLSIADYVTVATVLGLENVLDHSEGWMKTFGRERGRDPGLYYLRVFGEPGGQAPWGWRFGGHHVSLNNLVVDGAVVPRRRAHQRVPASIQRGMIQQSNNFGRWTEAGRYVADRYDHDHREGGTGR